MFRSAAAIFLALFFLVGSTLLPLGDLSLMTDLPTMYHSYTQVVNEEPDIVDFIGDYLLNGKELLGHNKHDAHTPTSAMQFQHRANSLNIVLLNIQLPVLRVSVISKKQTMRKAMFCTTDYKNELFRPPLT